MTTHLGRLPSSVSIRTVAFAPLALSHMGEMPVQSGSFGVTVARTRTMPPAGSSAMRGSRCLVFQSPGDPLDGVLDFAGVLAWGGEDLHAFLRPVDGVQPPAEGGGVLGLLGRGPFLVGPVYRLLPFDGLPDPANGVGCLFRPLAVLVRPWRRGP